MPNTGLEVESGYVAGASQALEDACAGNVASIATRDCGSALCQACRAIDGSS